MIWKGEIMQIWGIDVSRHQGEIDWAKVKESGVSFAIIKAGGSDDGFYVDRNFYKNVEGAKANGIHVGSYYYVGPKCRGFKNGIADAERFLNIIKSVKLDYPVYIDFEAPSRLYKKRNTEACNAFCQYIQNYGYYVGIYASDISGFKERLELNELNKFDKWVARYGSNPQYVKQYGMWQYTSKGAIYGITENTVDLNVAFKDYAQIIKQRHLNGF